jgi:hypothetical protein
MTMVAAVRTKNDNGGNSVDNSALALSHSLLAHATALIVAAWMTVHDDVSGRAEDGALPALLANPCLLMWQQQWRQRRPLAAERTTVPWYCWPFLALFCGGNNSSSANDGHDYQHGGCADEGALALLGTPCLRARPQQLQQCVQQCMATIGSNSVDNGALASLPVHCPVAWWQQWQ